MVCAIKVIIGISLVDPTLDVNSLVQCVQQYFDKSDLKGEVNIHS